jgi:hypothetical protein
MKPASEQSTNQALSDHAIEQHLNQALDQSVARLSLSVQTDITRVRTNALAAAQLKTRKTPIAARIQQKVSQLVTHPFGKVAWPTAAAVLIAIAINHHSPGSVPELPLAMVTSPVPTEELTLLEDLEFVTWLAENEQEALL